MKEGGKKKPVNQSSVFISNSFCLYPEDIVQIPGSKVTYISFFFSPSFSVVMLVIRYKVQFICFVCIPPFDFIGACCLYTEYVKH